MRTTTIVGVAALLVLAGSASAAAPARTGCTPGSFTAHGSSGVVFCGPAKATARVGGKTYAFKSGACTGTSKYLAVNIGTEVLSGPKRKYSYFAVIVGAYPGARPGARPASRDGTYAGGLVTVRWQGKDYVLNGAADKRVKVTLKKGRTAGTFSGSTFLAPHLKVTGSFSC